MEARRSRKVACRLVVEMNGEAGTRDGSDKHGKEMDLISLDWNREEMDLICP